MGRQALVVFGCRALAVYFAYKSALLLLSMPLQMSYLRGCGYSVLASVVDSVPPFIGYWIGAALFMYLAEPVGRFAGKGVVTPAEASSDGVRGTVSAAIPIFSLVLIAMAIPNLIRVLVETGIAMNSHNLTAREYFATSMAQDSLALIIYHVVCIALGVAIVLLRPRIMEVILGSRAASRSSKAAE